MSGPMDMSGDMFPPPGISTAQGSGANAATQDGLAALVLAMQTQMQTIQQQNQLHQQQQQQAMMDFFTALTNRPSSPPPSHGTELSGRKLDERHFRRAPIHDGKMPWKEWRTHFLTAVRKSLPQLADCLVRIETMESPIMANMDLQEFNPLWELSPLLALGFTGLTRDVSFSMVESTEGNGI